MAVLPKVRYSTRATAVLVSLLVLLTISGCAITGGKMTIREIRAQCNAQFPDFGRRIGCLKHVLSQPLYTSDPTYDLALAYMAYADALVARNQRGLVTVEQAELELSILYVRFTDIQHARLARSQERINMLLEGVNQSLQLMNQRRSPITCVSTGILVQCR
jgi:hypothetical protein